MLACKSQYAAYKLLPHLDAGHAFEMMTLLILDTFIFVLSDLQHPT